MKGARYSHRSVSFVEYMDNYSGLWNLQAFQRQWELTIDRRINSSQNLTLLWKIVRITIILKVALYLS